MKRIFPLIIAAFLVSACEISLDDTQPRVLHENLDVSASAGGVSCTLSGTYPQIQNLPSAQVEININAAFDAYANELKQQIQGCPESLAELVEPEAEVRDDTTVNFFVKRLDRYYFSVVIVASQQFAGAAHPNNSITTYTFSLRDGQPIALEDFFTRPEQAEADFTTRIVEALEAEGLEATYPSNTSNGISAYYLEDGHIVLTDLFATHAMKGFEVAIPITELKNLLKPGATL